MTNEAHGLPKTADMKLNKDAWLISDTLLVLRGFSARVHALQIRDCGTNDRNDCTGTSKTRLWMCIRASWLRDQKDMREILRMPGP